MRCSEVGGHLVQKRPMTVGSHECSICERCFPTDRLWVSTYDLAWAAGQQCGQKETFDLDLPPYVVDHNQEKEVEDVKWLKQIALLVLRTLHLAAWEGQAETVGYVLKVKPELSTRRNSTGESPLLLACKLGLLSVVNRLLSASTSASPATMDRVALHAAASAGHHAEMPLNSNPSIAVKPYGEGITPLHLAAKNGWTNIMRKILDNDPNSASVLTRRGETIFHFINEAFFPSSNEVLNRMSLLPQRFLFFLMAILAPKISLSAGPLHQENMLHEISKETVVGSRHRKLQTSTSHRTTRG
ncbi:Ankyrin-3 [Nymphaea thermarum]|nr:Ankyrin-3 [Nymphaea thermarum]